MAGVVLSPSSISAFPGGEAACTVTVRNTSSVVESYTVTVLGDAGSWSTVTPASISLFPGSDGTVVVTFRPARTAALPAGPVDFGVRVAATQDPDDSVVEEGTVVVEPFHELTAQLTPRNVETKRSAKPVVSITNRGNTPAAVRVSATDPDELLAFDLDDKPITVDPGASAAVVLKVAARSGIGRGPARHIPYQAVVSPDPSTGHSPIVVDGALVQRSSFPKFVAPLAAAAVILVLAAVLFPVLTKKDEKSGTFSLTGAASGVPTTVAGAAAGEAEDAEAEAEAEVEAGSDSGSGGDGEAGGESGSSPTTVAAAGGKTSSGGASPTTTAAPEDETTDTTAPSAAPVAASTTTTSTTAPPPKVYSQGTGLLHGTYSFDFDAGRETQTDADCFWRQVSYTERWLEPRGGAQFAHLGKPNFDSVTLAQLKSSPYSFASLSGGDSNDQLTVGTVIAVRTSAGRYAKVLVEARNVSDPSRYSIQNMQLRWVTYVP